MKYNPDCPECGNIRENCIVCVEECREVVFESIEKSKKSIAQLQKIREEDDRKRRNTFIGRFLDKLEF